MLAGLGASSDVRLLSFAESAAKLDHGEHVAGAAPLFRGASEDKGASAEADMLRAENKRLKIVNAKLYGFAAAHVLEGE